MVFTPPASSGCTQTLVTAQHKVREFKCLDRNVDRRRSYTHNIAPTHSARADFRFHSQSGVLFVLSASNMTRVLGKYQVAYPDGDGQFITTATWSNVTNLLYVVAPSDAGPTSQSATVVPGVAHGINAFNVSGASCTLTLVWHSSLGIPWVAGDLNGNAPYTSPVVAADVVWMGSGLKSGIVAASAWTGAFLWSATLRAPIFAAPIVASGRIYASDWSFAAGSGHLYAYW